MRFEQLQYWDLWQGLKQKFFPKPSVWVVQGRYPISYEHGYNWTIGYCDTKADAELVVKQLERELYVARQMLEKFYVAEVVASHRMHTYRSGEFGLSYDQLRYDQEYLKLQEVWSKASGDYRDAVDEVMKTMTDQRIPFPGDTCSVGPTMTGLFSTASRRSLNALRYDRHHEALCQKHPQQDLPDDPSVFTKIIGDTADEVNDKLVEMLFEVIKDDNGYVLFNKLRGIHVALSSQLGLVEEWMRTEIRRNMPHISEEVVDMEREEILDDGTQHVLNHVKLEFAIDDEEEEDEGESGMVH